MANERIIAGDVIEHEGIAVAPEVFPITIVAPNKKLARRFAEPFTKAGISVDYRRGAVRAEWTIYKDDPNVETHILTYDGKDGVAELATTVTVIRREILHQRKSRRE